jgi:shikimate kinase
MSSLPASVSSLVLIGFMGTGKSSVGREIARRCALRFVDTDSLIRKRFSKSIAEIFALIGEAAFRDEEHRCLSELQGAQQLVLATGGGIVLQRRNHPLLRQLGPIIWLTATEEVIWERVSRHRSRPLLYSDDPRATIRNLIKQRYPLYDLLADITVETTGLTHPQVADCIIKAAAEWSGRSHEKCD